MGDCRLGYITDPWCVRCEAAGLRLFQAGEMAKVDAVADAGQNVLWGSALYRHALELCRPSTSAAAGVGRWSVAFSS